MDADRDLHRAVKAAGYLDLIIDPQEPRAGRLITVTGVEVPVFIRFAKKPTRFAAELAALQLLAQRLGSLAPAPRLLAAFPEIGAGVLLLSYEPGVDLAALLPLRANIPALPVTYTRIMPAETSGAIQSFEPVETIPPVSSGELTDQALYSALEAAGRAVKRLHQVTLDRFGLLVGEDPNPYRMAARQHTRQEACHALQICLERGLLDLSQQTAIADWLAGKLEFIADDEPPCLIHYDLHAGNIRFYQDQRGNLQFRTLLDFELARGWLPEYDLAVISWYLRAAEENWWQAFLRGYAGLHPFFTDRLALFEMVKSLQMIASSKDALDWGQWGRTRLGELLRGASV